MFVGMTTLVATLEKQKAVCELYIDNYNIALVRRMGREYGGQINLRFNAKSSSSSRDTSELITRLYPYGMDDLDISTVNGGKQYIDSPLIDSVGVYEGYSEFNECEEPDELLELARWQFNADNLNRIDVPKYNMELSFVDVSAMYKNHTLITPKLGDRVSVTDEQLGTKTTQRIIGMVTYPFEPQKSTVEVGKARITIESFFAGLCQTQLQQTRQTNGKKEVKTSFVEALQRNARVNINRDLQNEKIALYKTGALFESTDGSCAVAIIKGQIAIANSKIDGEWNWTTIMNAGQVIVNEVFTGKLFTDLCEVLSENGKLSISGSMITMLDAEEKTRFRCGYDEDAGKYVFEMYDAASASPTVYMNDNGDVIFAGEINTGKDAVVGHNLTIGNKQEAVSSVTFKGTVNDAVLISDSEEKIFTFDIPYCLQKLTMSQDGIRIDGEQVATKRDIESVEKEIDELQKSIQKLQDKIKNLSSRV